MLKEVRFSAVKRLVFPESVPQQKRERLAENICNNITLMSFDMRKNGYDAVTIQNSKGDYLILIDDKTAQDATDYINAKNKSFKTNYIDTRKGGCHTVIEKEIGKSGKIYHKYVQDFIDKLTRKASDVNVEVKNINPFEYELFPQI